MNNSAGDGRSRAVRIAKQRLEGLERAGVTHVPKRRKAAAGAAKPSAAPVAAVAEAPPAKGASVSKPEAKPSIAKPTAVVAETSLLAPEVAQSPNLSRDERIAALSVIQSEVAGCTRCKVLADTRTQTVFGVGNPEARICFFGEAPGADEDRQGEPFVGRAGQLLNKMITACGLKREEVYILNVLKCRPPENRNPLPNEVTNCRGYFERQLDIIRPEIICCLGAVAAQSLLQTEVTIGKLRRKFHDHRGIPVICTYHPAYLLRNPAAKVDAWEDLKMMMRRLGVEL